MLSLKHWSGGPYSLEEVEGMASVFFGESSAPSPTLSRLALADPIGDGFSGAGTDTAAVVLRAFVYYMVKNPSVHAELMEEIDAAVAKGELHFPTAHAEAIKLLYFKVTPLPPLLHHLQPPLPTPPPPSAKSSQLNPRGDDKEKTRELR